MSYGLNVEMHKQTEISKRLSALINQLVPFLSQEHQQQVSFNTAAIKSVNIKLVFRSKVLSAVERAKQITMSELNAVIGVSIFKLLSQTIFDLTKLSSTATTRFTKNSSTNACTATSWRRPSTHIAYVDAPSWSARRAESICAQQQQWSNTRSSTATCNAYKARAYASQPSGRCQGTIRIKR